MSLRIRAPCLMGTSERTALKNAVGGRAIKNRSPGESGEDTEAKANA